MLPFVLAAPLAHELQLTPNGYFGAPRPKRNGVHMGIDLQVSAGEAVYAAAAGVVARVGFDPPVSAGGGGGGNYVIVTTNGYELGYMHLASISVNAGDPIAAGAELGTAGATGTTSSGPHLHLQAKIPASPDGHPERFVNITGDLLPARGGAAVAAAAAVVGWLVTRML